MGNHERISDDQDFNKILEIINQYHHNTMKFWTVTPEKRVIYVNNIKNGDTDNHNNNRNGNDDDGDFRININCRDYYNNMNIISINNNFHTKTENSNHGNNGHIQKMEVSSPRTTPNLGNYSYSNTNYDQTQ